MEKNIRVKSAEETLEILNKGHYLIDDRKIDIHDKVNNSINNSSIIQPEDFEKINERIFNLLSALDFKTQIEVVNCSVLEAMSEWSGQFEKTGCLNFASAKNPGGGFLNGAQAQEESLARASCLYLTQVKHKEMYAYNKGRNTYLYSDYMIYSPEVVFFKDDNDQLLQKPYTVSILTSPAVNVGAIKNNRPSELDQVKDVMISRIDKVLSVFVDHKIDHLILGAWGCGVFQNDPSAVANWFYDAINPNGKFGKAFKKISFAIFDRSKDKHVLQPFIEKFKHENTKII